MLDPSPLSTAAPGGITIDDPLTHMQGVLTGVPTFHGGTENILVGSGPR